MDDQLTMKSVNEYDKECQKHFRAVSELIASSRTTVDDLYAARIGWMAEANKRKAADQKEAFKRQKRLSADQPAGSQAQPKAPKQQDDRDLCDWKLESTQRIQAVTLDDFQKKSFTDLRAPWNVSHSGHGWHAQEG